MEFYVACSCYCRWLLFIQSNWINESKINERQQSISETQLVRRDIPFDVENIFNSNMLYMGVWRTEDATKFMNFRCLILATWLDAK